MMITVLRYLYVVHSMKVKQFGMSRVVKIVVIISILLPAAVTISVQYPVSDFIHGPFNLCIGRFEVYFNPYHPDTITEGNKLRYCGHKQINNKCSLPILLIIDYICYF